MKQMKILHVGVVVTITLQFLCSSNNNNNKNNNSSNKKVIRTDKQYVAN